MSEDTSQPTSIESQPEAEQPADAPANDKPRPDATELAWETLAMCVRACIVVSFLGFIMWWGFHRDQADNPAAAINPHDISYIQSNPGRMFQKGDFDTIFEYPEMIDFYRDDVVLDFQNSQIGSFITRDGLRRVYNYYLRRLNNEGLVIESPPIEEQDPKKSRTEWTMTALDADQRTQYSVRALRQPNGGTRVFFQKSQLQSDVERRQARQQDPASTEMPIPPGRYETYQISTTPGSLFGATRNYLSEHQVDANYHHFNTALQRRGWQRSTLKVPETTELGGRSAMYRKGMHTCLVNIAPMHNDKDWRSIVSLTMF